MTTWRTGRAACLAALSLAAITLGCGGGSSAPSGPTSHVIEIDIDDHGLAGLWMASAPNIKGLIARGTLAFTRVVVPTHSNQNNMSLLTGQYPDGNNVPANDWLGRDNGFVSPVSVGGELNVGDYAVWDKNPLRVRGDSVYGATHAAGGRSAYVGELPPFEAGADDVHLSIVGTMFETPLGPLTVDATSAKNLLTDSLGYPSSVAGSYSYDGPPASGETQTQFTLRDAADTIRNHPMPAFMFVWDFIALDDDADQHIRGRRRADRADHRGLRRRPRRAARGAHRQEPDSTARTSSSRSITARSTRTTRWCSARRGGANADGQLAALVTSQGPAMGLDTGSYALLNEDGDAQIYAVVPGAGTAGGAAAQADVTHKLLTLIQSGAIIGLDTTRTLTADGALGTRSFHDFRAASPNQADIVVFPKDDWTLNKVDATNTTPGPFQEHTHVPVRPARRLLGRRALRPAHHGRPGVQERRDAAAPGAAPRGRADRAGAARQGRRQDGRLADRRARRRSRRRWSAIPARRSPSPTHPTARAIWCWPASGFAGTPPAPTATATNVDRARRGGSL